MLFGIDVRQSLYCLLVAKMSCLDADTLHKYIDASTKTRVPKVHHGSSQIARHIECCGTNCKKIMNNMSMMRQIQDPPLTLTINWLWEGRTEE